MCSTYEITLELRKNGFIINGPSSTLESSDPRPSNTPKKQRSTNSSSCSMQSTKVTKHYPTGPQGRPTNPPVGVRELDFTSDIRDEINLPNPTENLWTRPAALQNMCYINELELTTPASPGRNDWLVIEVSGVARRGKSSRSPTKSIWGLWVNDEVQSVKWSSKFSKSTETTSWEIFKYNLEKWKRKENMKSERRRTLVNSWVSFRRTYKTDMSYSTHICALTTHQW